MKSKGKKKGYIGIAITAILLIVTVVADLLVSRYITMIKLYFRDDSNSVYEMSADEALSQAADLTEELGNEGIVLLKNKDNASLPLAAGTKINLFGIASYQTLYQGSGSASSWFKQDLNTNMKKGLEDAGFEVNPGLWQFYEDNYKERSDQEGGMTDMSGADHSILEQSLDEYEAYDYEGENVLTYSENYSDVAMVVIGRAGGEGSDATMEMDGYVGGDAGKHYLELQSVEQELLSYVEEHYDKVIVVLNTAMVMETGFLDDEAIDAALWIGMPGSRGCGSLGNILAGEVNPSGHLADIYAYDLTTAPSYYNFGDYTYSNFDGNNKYVYYQEGIYVGYRYYETAAADGYIDYDTTVQFPFGYGLSYTNFDWEVEKTELGDIGGTINIDVKVTNTGDVAGKDVVELYYAAPYDPAEEIEKSSVVLGAFEKTNTLKPGESETVTLTMNVDDMASYDYKNNKCYVLSAGDYEFRLQTDSHNMKVNSDGTAVEPIAYTVDSKVVYNDTNQGKRSTDEVAAENLFDAVTAGDGYFGADGTVGYVSRSDWAGTMPTSRETNMNVAASDETVALMTNNTSGWEYDLDNLPDAEPAVTGVDSGLEISDMTGLKFDDPKRQQLVEEMSVDELRRLYGTCGWSNPAILSINKAAAIDMDGAEGLHNLTSDKTANQYVGSTVRAATWNKELAYRMGTIYGDECLANGISGMYGMTVNIHRSPFGGRCFEAYSEDPTLSGKIAAEEIRGLQDKKIAVYLKHFVANDQETNRGGVHTWVDEQALREIYCRPFEIVTKEADCNGYMTSYNYIGTGWTGASKPLVTDLARGEWGSHGRMITDAAMDFTIYVPDTGVLAGLDMWLAPQTAVTTKNLYGTDYGIRMLQESAHRQLYVFANTSGVGLEMQEGNTWKLVVGGANAILILGMALSIIFLVIPGFRGKKGEKKNEETVNS